MSDDDFQGLFEKGIEMAKLFHIPTVHDISLCARATFNMDYALPLEQFYHFALIQPIL